MLSPTLNRMDGPAESATTPRAASAPRTGLRRVVPGVVLVAFVVVGALAGGLFVSSQSGPSFPPERSVGWILYDGFGPSTFNPSTADTTTVVTVRVGVPSCLMGDTPRDSSWLAPPAITYTPSTVTITLLTNDAFERTSCFGTLNGRRVIGYVLDSYTSVRVQLSEPLRGRALFDGSTSPPKPRPYTTQSP